MNEGEGAHPQVRKTDDALYAVFLASVIIAEAVWHWRNSWAF